LFYSQSDIVKYISKKYELMLMRCATASAFD